MKYKIKIILEHNWNMSTDWVVWLRENFGIGRATWAASKEKPDERYQFKAPSSLKNNVMTLYFKNKEDAILFKLIWG